MCYAVEGKGSKSFDMAKGFCFQHPEAAHVLLQKNWILLFYTLKEKVKAGVNAVQILILGAECCLQLIIKNSLGNTSTIIEALADVTPVIVLERMLVCFERNGKRKVELLLGVGGLAHKKQILVWWKYHFTREF
jgi:hypothetical protein